MPLLVYIPAALALLWLMHRCIRPVSRAAAIVLFLLPFAFVGPALLLNRVYAPIDRTYVDPPLSELREEYGIGAPHNRVSTDIYSQMIPWRHVVREAVGNGEWPLWNPYILAGDVLAASAQSAPYSPFTWLAILMPAAISFTFTAAITFFLAGAAAFAFARELGCRESVSLFAAAGFVCSTSMVLYVLWPLGICWAFLPLVLLGTRRIVAEPGLASWALLTASLTLLMLAGHPETVLHIVTIGGIYGVFELVQRPRWQSLATAVAAGVVTLLLCAIYLLPILHAIPQTGEYLYRRNNYAKAEWRGSEPADIAVRLAVDAFPFLHLRDVKRPPMKDPKAEAATVGSIVLGLAVFAVWRVRSRITWFFAGLALFCILGRCEWRPLIRLFQKLPLYDIALHERFAFAAAFCFVVLAALGLEHLLARDDRRAAAITLAAVCVALAIGTWWIQRTWVIEGGPEWGRWKTAAELAGLAIAAVVVALRVPVAPLLLALLLVQRVTSEGGIWKSFPARAAYPPVALFEPLQTIREPFRVTGLGYTLIPGTNALYGLEDVRGYEAMTLMRLVETWGMWCQYQVVWFNRVDDLSKPFLSMMNVRFAVAHADAPAPGGWREIARQGGTKLLENASALPRVFVPRHVTIGMDRLAALEQMATQTDFADRAWISDNVPVAEHTNGPGRVSISRPAFGRYELQADMQSAGWIVLSESAWEGWRAYLDGRRVAVRLANNAFLGVLVPAGKHHVRLVYRPRAFDVGLRITATTVLALIIGMIVWRRRR